MAVLLVGFSVAPAPGPAAVQWAADSTSVRLAPGAQYNRGAVWRFFLGAHYRDLWATPVTVPVVRMATAVPGGLTPMQAGGSFQSHTLRLCAASGREFVLRSVDKDMGAAVPVGFWRDVLGGLMKDQTSITQPYAAYAAAPLADAAGVYHTSPRLVYVPDDSGLLNFRASYANALYLLEERPDGDQRAVASFGHSLAVMNTRRMLLSIHQEPRAQVAARAYLRARLLDIWLGDWSRREDQWRWASFAQAGRTEFRPIPRDRDQAFFLFDDGVLTRAVSWFVPKYQSFRATLRPGSVDGLTRTARALDRTLLGPLTADDYRREADSLQRRLTDAAITQALATSPPETRTFITTRFRPMLRARRAQLPAIALRYYQLMAEESWVVGTDAPERFIISGVGPGQVRVQLLLRRPDQVDSLISVRTYNRTDTKLLNLYGLAGNDVFELRGPVSQGIAVHLYDGAGEDQVLLPTAKKTDFSDITWHASPGGDATRRPAGLPTEPDPQPALTATAHGWLRHYRLRE